jgi:alkanesulfonate monooxygenase SsuD/methylene tetrahydromethanopterin reductase-like flavin-dependent oxidoreductase (luciferase family)
LWPPAEGLLSRMWEATFGIPGAIRAAEHGSGLLLARTATRSTPDAGGDGTNGHKPLGEVQLPVVEAYLKSWTSTEAAPRIGLSRSAYVAPTRAEALSDAEPGMQRFARLLAQRTGVTSDLPVEELLAKQDMHIGSPEDVISSLRADPLLEKATDLILQVHPVDPAPEKTLRSIELIANEVAPALGWSRASQKEGRYDYARN